MSSQNIESVSDVIRKLSEWSMEELEEHLSDTLDALLSVLDCPDQKLLSLQAVQALLNRCLPCVPVDSVEDKLFQHVLPSTKHLFSETLEGIHIRLQVTENQEEGSGLLESLNSLLQVCIELLKCVGCTFNYILSCGKVEAALIPSVPKITASILLEAFRHCKESEEMYGTLFQALGEALTTLFQKSYELQLQFLNIVTENLQFACMYEDELILLIEILDLLSQIGQLVTGLDVKIMAELWKGYARLALQHVEHLKPRLDVASPLKFLATDIMHNLGRIVEMEPPDMKFITRTVKVASFSLKIIIKFCDQYNGYLGTCQQELFQMLLTIYRYSRPYLQLKNVPNDIIQNVETHLTIGAEPLLTYLITEVEFVEKFFIYGEKLVEKQNRFAFLLLSTAVLKKLLHSNQDVRKLWLNSESAYNVLSVLFRVLDNCHAEMSWDLQIPIVRVSGESERMTDLYELLVTHVAGLVLSTSIQEFTTVEQVLLESVLQPTVWRALLAIDVWCIIARSGSSELCYHQLCHLVEVQKYLSGHRGCPEKIYLIVLINRLFSFLSSKHKILMVEKFPPESNPFVWKVLGTKVLSGKLKAAVTESLLMCAISHTEKFLANPMSMELYNSMVSALEATQQCLEIQEASQEDIVLTLSNLILNVWQRLTMNEIIQVEEINDKGSFRSDYFMSVLCSVTAPLMLKMNNSELIQILLKLKDVISSGSSLLRLKVVAVLYSLANKFIDSTSDQIQVFQHIASLFSALLQDKNQLVQQMTLEVFTYFAHVNSHESILALSVRNNIILQQKTRRYLQKLPVTPPEGNFLTFEAYINCQSQMNFSHACRISVNTHDNDTQNFEQVSCVELNTAEGVTSDDQPPKKLRMCDNENVVTEAIERLKNDANIVVNYCKSNALLPAAKEELLQIAIQLKELG